MTTVLAGFMLVMAAGIAGMWTVDILRSPEITGAGASCAPATTTGA